MARVNNMKRHVTECHPGLSMNQRKVRASRSRVTVGAGVKEVYHFVVFPLRSCVGMSKIVKKRE